MTFSHSYVFTNSYFSCTLGQGIKNTVPVVATAQIRFMFMDPWSQ